MKRWMLCSLMLALPVYVMSADDEKKEDKPVVQKAPDWSKYSTAVPASGEVVKVSETGLTLRNQTRQRSGNGYKTVNIDVDYTWNEQGLARREKAPTFFDDKGLPRPAKSGELAKLRKPIGVKGYAMERSDIKNGDLVRLELVRLRTISASKAKPEDYTIKYAFWVGEKPNPTAPPRP